MTVNSSVRLRELCETVDFIRFVGGDPEKVTLLDKEGNSINQIFADYTKTSPAKWRKAYVGDVSQDSVSNVSSVQ